jgi:hypothetical protein
MSVLIIALLMCWLGVAGDMADNPSLIEVESKQQGVIQLRRLQRKDLRFLRELRDSELSSRELVVRFIHNQLYHSDTTQEMVQQWPDTLLEQIVITWVGEQGEGWRLAQEDSVFDAFESAFRNYLKDYLRAMKEARQLIPLSGFTGLDFRPMFLGTNHLSGMSSALGGISIGSNSSLAAVGLTRSVEAAQKMIAQSIEPALSTIKLHNQTAKHIVKASELAVSSIQRSLDGSLAALTKYVSGLTLDLNKTLQAMIQTKVINVFDSLPNFAESYEKFREGYQGGLALEQTGYGFVFPLWSFPEARRFYKAAQVNPKVRHAAITNRVLSLTRNAEFEGDLRYRFEHSSLLKSRWEIVQAGLRSHCRRDYLTSIPTLLPQIEGILADMLVAKSTIVRRKQKLYATDANGKLKRGKDGKNVEIHGLGQLVQNSRLQNGELLKGVANYIADRLAPERHPILHGRNVKYGSPKRSAQLLLVLWILAVELSDFEGEQPN